MIKELKRWFIQKRAKYFDFRYIAVMKRVGDHEYRTHYKRKWFLKKKYRRPKR